MNPHPQPRAVAAPTESPWTLERLGDPAVVLQVFGTPGPQGSKNGFAVSKKGKGGQRVYTGKVAMTESSKKVKPWRDAVKAIAEATVLPEHRPLLDGPLVADLVLTLARPQRPKHPVYPITYPDLSKLARSTEDALTGVAWADDARVIAYRRLDKVYVGSTDPDALPAPGALIRVWAVPAAVQLALVTP